MKLIKIKCLFICLLSLLISSCEAKEDAGLLANICVSIAVNKDTTPQFLNEFDSFAKSSLLSIDDTHPLGREYKSGDESVVVNIVTGMGPYGAIVSLYLLNEESGDNINKSLYEFIWTDVTKRFDVKDCKDIGGFKIPKLYD